MTFTTEFQIIALAGIGIILCLFAVFPFVIWYSVRVGFQMGRRTMDQVDPDFLTTEFDPGDKRATPEDPWEACIPRPDKPIQTVEKGERRK